MLRLQWFTLSGLTPARLPDLAARMLEDRYTSETNAGFLVDDVRPKTIRGRYVQRELVVQIFEDPFGNPQRFEHTVFQITRFNIDLKRTWIEVQNGPRSLAPFFSQLAEHSDFLASVEPIYLQPLDWFHSFRKIAPDALMTRALIDDFQVAEGVTARASLIGEIDVEQYIQTVTGRRRVTASAIQVTFNFDSEIYRLSVAAGGKVKFFGAVQDASLDLVRDTVSAMKSS